MLTDTQLLSAIPDRFCFGFLAKATPVEDGGERVLYIEASNEDAPDYQNEIVLQKALSESADFFLRHGNIDLDHYSLMGPKAGIPDFMSYEIGKPLAAQVDNSRTFVKAQLYQGESPMARNANMVWDSLTRQSPPARWYPSVGGSVLSKSIRIDPDTGAKVGVVDKVRWSNVALSRTPVHKTVPEVSMTPIGTFAKSLGGFVFEKSLTAGYATDSAAMTGGAAMRGQSLDHQIQSYWDFREYASDYLLKHRATNPGARELYGCARDLGLSADEATEWVERFLRDVNAARRARANHH